MERAAPHLFRGKLEDRFLVKGLTRFQDRAGEVGMIRRIREVLGLEAEAVATLVDVAVFSNDGAIEKISSVELNARLRR